MRHRGGDVSGCGVSNGAYQTRLDLTPGHMGNLARLVVKRGAHAAAVGDNLAERAKTSENHSEFAAVDVGSADAKAAAADRTEQALVMQRVVRPGLRGARQFQRQRQAAGGPASKAEWKA